MQNNAVYLSVRANINSLKIVDILVTYFKEQVHDTRSNEVLIGPRAFSGRCAH